jgi:translocation protein SEC63
LKVEEPTVDDHGSDEDDISDPDEDTLAGQMAAMRGGSVKKNRSEESDESSTDDDKESSFDNDSFLFCTLFCIFAFFSVLW